MVEMITITKKEYIDLIHKAHGCELQGVAFLELRKEIKPTEKDMTLPWYDMLIKCVKERKFQ